MNEELKKEYSTILDFMGTKEDTAILRYRLEREETVIDTLQFKTDYQMLFTVVDKIEGLPSQRLGGFIVKTDGNITTIYSKNKTKKDSINIIEVRDNRKESIYYACLRFIEWYNKTNLK